MYDKAFGKNKEKLESLLARSKEKNHTGTGTGRGAETIHNVVDESIEIPSQAPNTNIQIIGNNRQNANYYKANQSNQNNIPANLINMSTSKLFNWLGIPTKYDELIYYSKWWKFYDNCITVLNILIILLAFYDYELNFSYPRKIVADYGSVRLVMIALAFTSIFCVIRRHYMKNRWKNIKVGHKILIDNAYGEGTSSSITDFFFNEDSFVLGGKKAKLFSLQLYFDVIVNLLLPYPGLDFFIYIDELDRDVNKLITVDYLFSDFIYIVVLLRSLYIIRAFVNYSIFSDHFAFTVSKSYKVKNNFRFAVKCLLKIYHIKLVMWVFFASVFIFGFMLRIFERPFWVEKGRIEFDSYLSPIWCTFISMLTIGYGDFAPLTTLGKVVIYISSLWGVFMSSLIIVCLQGLLELSNDQFLVFTKILKSRAAVEFIESAYTFHKSRFIISRKNIQQTKQNYSEMLQQFEVFKNMRNESKSIYRSNGLLHYNMRLLKEMKKLNQRMDKLEMDVEASKKKV